MESSFRQYAVHQRISNGSPETEVVKQPDTPATRKCELFTEAGSFTARYGCYIHCVSKKVPTFKVSVTLSNLNRFSKFLHCWEAYNLLQNSYDTAHLTLGMLLQYLGEKNSNFSRYSANMEKMQANCTLIASNFVTRPKILIFFGA